jgi:two-component system LytT family response regulator
VETIRALIVDDEPIARRGIRMQLESQPGIEIIGECANGLEAVAAIQDHAPDLVFLDVQMPEMDGFAVVEAVGIEQMPAVVFVTAHDQYALRAFEVHAVDYLLKPFDRERFGSALAHARSQIARRATGGLREQLLALLQEQRGGRRYLERMVVRSAGRIFFLQVAEIDRIESADNYVELHVGKRSHLVRETLARLETRLDPDRFVRIRHSTIVNLAKIQEFRPSAGGEYDVVLRSGEVLTTSRRYRKKLAAILER